MSIFSNNIIFHSFEAGCVSNSSLKQMKNTHKQFNSIRVNIRKLTCYYHKICLSADHPHEDDIKRSILELNEFFKRLVNEPQYTTYSVTKTILLNPVDLVSFILLCIYLLHIHDYDNVLGTW